MLNNVLPVLKNKSYRRKELLKNFCLNGHIVGFHPQTLNLQPILHVSKRGSCCRVKWDLFFPN